MSETNNRKKPAMFAANVRQTDYRRQEHLAALTGLWPADLNDTSPAAAERVVMALRKSLRAERQRGKAGHWCYDLNRHLVLKKALADEIMRLEEIRKRARKVSLAYDGGPASKSVNANMAEARTTRRRVATLPPDHHALLLELPTASSS